MSGANTGLVAGDPDQFHFERLLAEISTYFINLPPDRIDDGIATAQSRIRECLDLDRSSLWIRPTDDSDLFLLSFLSQAAELERFQERMEAKGLFPWALRKLIGGETLVISRMSDLPPEAEHDRRTFRQIGTRSVVVVPLAFGGESVFGILTFAVMRQERSWSPAMVEKLQLVAQMFTNVLARRRADLELRERESRLREQLEENQRLRLQLEHENVYLRDEILLRHAHEEIVGRSVAIRQVLTLVEQVAATEATVLLEGETGTGKELLARTIHNLSKRQARPLITVNCAALPPTLIESELFGREKGAYTGAMTRMAGRFELADRSSLFLDEIGELPLETQAKLLRVLEEGRFERLGSTQPLRVDVRVIAATNRDLAHEVGAGRFRKDLYYRLRVFPLSIPPLRERSEDIPLMVWAFVKQFEKKMGKRIDRISRASMDALQRHSWPGNARELRNLVEYAMITSTDGKLRLRPFGPAVSEAPALGSLEEVERSHILKVLSKTGWRVAGRGGAAEIMGVKRTTLLSRMKRLGINRPA